MTTPPAAPMPASPAAETRSRRSVVTVLGAVAHLAALGVVGSLFVTVLVALLGLGIGLTPVLGIGLLFLTALVYCLFATGWLEVARVDGLYRLGLPALQFVPRVRPGFGGYVATLWRQFTDGPMWRAVASATVSFILGAVALPAVAALSVGIVALFAPLYSEGPAVALGNSPFEVAVGWAPVIGVLLVVVSAAILLGLALLHGMLARTILGPNVQAQQAQAQAQVSAQQREGAVRASEVERTRIERDLHDGVQPRLVSVGMTLGLAQQKLDDDPQTARALIEEAHTSTKAAITELRQLARGIHASVLDDRGLDAALSALAGRSHIPVHLDVRVDGRCSREAEAAVYFSIAESLTNAAKHSRASEARVVVRVRDGGTLWARVEDNGLGGARVVPGGGIDGISNRVLAAGGSLRLDSPQGGPTSLEVSVPCAS